MGAAVGGAVRGITAGVRAAAPKAVGALGRIGTSLKGVATGSGIRAQGQLAQRAGAKATQLRAAAAPLSPGKMKDWRLHRAAEAGKQATTARWGQVKEVGKTVGLYGGGSAALGGAGYGALSGPPQPKLAAFQDAFFDELTKIAGAFPFSSAAEYGKALLWTKRGRHPLLQGLLKDTAKYRRIKANPQAAMREGMEKTIRSLDPDARRAAGHFIPKT